MTREAWAEAEARAEALARDAEGALALAGGEPPLLLLSVVADGGAEPLRALSDALDGLRALSSRERVRALGAAQGYRLEDARLLVLGLPPGAPAAALEEWLRRRLAPESALRVVVREGPLTLAALLALRTGGAPARGPYARGADGRVRVEAFELHVAEHCNLRCSSCCNMSPLVRERFLPVAEVAALARRMAGVVVADVVKVMGGEPLLHPEVPAVLRALRESGVGERVRLFTNGLLLPSMPEDFWGALDELTISNYASAPVRPRVLDMVRERSLRHGFVLNVKPVSEFSHVLSPRYEADDARVQGTFARCWLRHRCLIARGGRFYMCTRAAYADDFLARVAHAPPPPGVTLDRSGDGVPLDAPDLVERLVAYLNRTEPLGACRYCFGGDGASAPHVQLTREEVARGILSRGLLPQGLLPQAPGEGT
jgi:hypothetical protein